MAQQRFMILTDEQVAKAIVTQLRNHGVVVERVEDTVGKGTLDPELLEYAYTNGYTLLTHDERIVGHITARLETGKEHAGVFIALHHLRNSKGVGQIIEEIVFWHQAVQAGAATLQNDVYNQIRYIS
jgi:predicted nuclease of predicted toxin-antitoxin system